MGEESVLRALRACRPSKTRVLLNPIRIGRRPLTNKKLPRERASPMFSNPTAVTFIGYLIVMVGVGVFAYYYTRSYTDFILGGRSLGGFVTALSVGASDMSGWLLMGLPGAVFLFGVSQSWIAIGLILGSWLNWRFAAARLRVYTEKAHNSLTLPDYLTHRFEDKSNALRIIASAVILIFFTIYCASGVVAGARLFENTFHMEYETALIIGAAATILYVFIGGFLAVSWTDTIQAAIMCVALVVTPIAVMYDAGGFSATTARLAEINPSMLNMMEGQTVIGVISLLAWGLGYFGQPHILVRFMAAKSIKVIPNARRVATLWMLFCLAGAVGVGFFGAAYFSLHPDVAGLVKENHERVFIVLSSLLFNPWIAGLLMSAILAAVMSTLSCQLLAGLLPQFPSPQGHTARTRLGRPRHGARHFGGLCLDGKRPLEPGALTGLLRLGWLWRSLWSCDSHLSLVEAHDPHGRALRHGGGSCHGAHLEPFRLVWAL